MRILALVFVVGIVLFLGGCSLVSSKLTGIPIGRSERAGGYIATLIMTEEASLPSLHRRPENDRYRIGLLLDSVDSPERRRLIPVARGLPYSEFRHGARILELEGRRLWFYTHQLAAYDLDREALVAAEEVRHAEPRLKSLGRSSMPRFQLEALDSYLSPAASVVAGAPQGAKVLRSAAGGALLRLSNPEGFLITYRSDRGLKGTQMVARVDASGKLLWNADTGIADLDQILPDARRPAFLGRRPMEPGKVREPVLTILDAGSGAVSMRSLFWK